MKRLAIVALVSLILLGMGGVGVLLWWYHSLDSFAQTPFGSDEPKVLEVRNGAGLKAVARDLERAGVVSDAKRFDWVSRRVGKDRQIKAGEYEFAGPMLPEKVLEVLAQGKVKLYHCTIPEGLRADEIAPILEKCGFGKADEILTRVRDASFAKQLELKGASSLEGYLYPDTYSFPKNPKVDAVLQKMVSRFREEYKKADGARKPGIKLDMHQAATLASIVEKETGAPAERPRIACVFHNRLKKGMRLETDPTVIYAKILRLGSFDGNLKREDMQFLHPYNTYKVKGLPPGPIANAGQAALAATLAPVDCTDLFFVACGGGTHQFCPDYKCHQRFVDICQLGKMPAADAPTTAAKAPAKATASKVKRAPAKTARRR